jgi:hypothetical protein
MVQHSHTVLTLNRADTTAWLTEMLNNGWRLLCVDAGLFYFENVDAIVTANAEAIRRNVKNNGEMRNVLDTAVSAGIEGARKAFE